MRPVAGRRQRFAFALVGAVGLGLALPAALFAHPLGNFTINHYAGLRISATAVQVDFILDFAEIPTFQERQRIDLSADGVVDAAEIETERLAMCGVAAQSLGLASGGVAVPLVATAAGLSFPPGAGGLETMRAVCTFTGVLAPPLAGPTTVSFEDRTWADRIGWREIVAIGDGVTVRASVPSVGTTDRLTRYPVDLLAQPLDQRSATIEVSPGGLVAPPFVVPDAEPLPGVVAPSPVASAAPSPSPSRAAIPEVGAIPGGITDEISALLEVKDLTPLAILGSLLVAAFLGALHALSPGHGKTVMAAYLVGSRGSARHAIALGLTVTVSHTLGVLALALVTVGASNIIPPERLYPVLGLASGAVVVGIGLWLLYGRWRIWSNRRALAAAHAPDHIHAPSPVRVRAARSWATAGAAHGGVVVASVDSSAATVPHSHDSEAPGMHSHGGIRHSHLLPPGSDLTWKSLFSLGLAGGLVPSASALLLLLGSLAANRPAYGVVLVIAFGVGMAVVLGGVGLLLVYATRYVERLPTGRIGRRAWDALPVATALVVIAAGLYLTSQAVTQVF